MRLIRIPEVGAAPRAALVIVTCYRVAGGGLRLQWREFMLRPFGNQVLAPRFRRLKAERLSPEGLTPVAVTPHLRIKRYN